MNIILETKCGCRSVVWTGSKGKLLSWVVPLRDSRASAKVDCAGKPHYAPGETRQFKPKGKYDPFLAMPIFEEVANDN